MGPELALATQAAGSLASGIAGKQAAEAQQQQASLNAKIARTRAIQTDTVARENLNSELGSMRSVFGANGQRPGVGTMEVMSELRSVRDRERRIDVGNQNAQAADWRMQARNAGSQGNAAFLGGVIGAGPSLFDIYDYRSKSG